ncbi:MAG TPA: 3-hydroxyacyl-CoA dehydrogenase NAD-binding domain-containing protein [Flavobacteriales bacterium]|nr:3-hydroxybutyryl-CoA dehydrogenase [Flavobacteriales bacterium]HRE74370.1 3-hydroxyacyl-CoA dehydrogenase NAD-binding domain-containing protein [Flavobacteriales bacterium]HRE98567.1 3-hydroxyacyl-CoA dehydrogenase NAD-binding domain-containing protein [Flavobacteriales bacterium]HRJ36296.1 3-hydroxyacyl-CoA dehydrogenase NAD-binding domain-containing protein [Flavobacteriales bacterium]HRJ39326.1 3-hydroxyacyl-CoA dehydrogenase NAD-binding domain-containing protein [Flavobacteriales bacteri
MKIGIAGAGAMGSGIAQVAAMNGHEVVLYDAFAPSIEKADTSLNKILNSLQEKGKISNAAEILNRIKITGNINDFSGCGLVIEAIIEQLPAKQELFRKLEEITGENSILASNTSSLSVTLIAASCKKPERVVGIHFFNPAPLMPLVEIIPAVQSDLTILEQARKLIDSWGKTTVLAKDTPGFIVNRVARPYYGEAIRIYEEGVADFATIDWAMKEMGGFRMGPFELMDFIGNDINYTVTETVFREFFYDPRYRPSFTQKRQMESGRLGRKSGRGYYDYSEGAQLPEAKKDKVLGEKIVNRVLAMLINEAADALYLNIATAKDLDLAMTKGVNYPKGLLTWCDELGAEKVYAQLRELQDIYGEDRYRPSPLLRKHAENKTRFFSSSIVEKGV